MTSGEFPESWSKAIIAPLLKNGNAVDVNNYRGISLYLLLVNY